MDELDRERCSGSATTLRGPPRKQRTLQRVNTTVTTTGCGETLLWILRNASRHGIRSGAAQRKDLLDKSGTKAEALLHLRCSDLGAMLANGSPEQSAEEV